MQEVSDIVEGSSSIKTLKYIVLIGMVGICSFGQIHSQDTLSVAREQQFTYYWYAAKQAMDEQRYADAFVLFDFCNQLNPDDATTLSFLGLLYDATEQTDKALDYFRQAYEKAPTDHWFRYWQTLMNQRTEESKQRAKQVLEQTKKMSSPNTDEDLLQQLLRMYITDGEWKKALAIQKEIDRVKGYDAYSALTYYRIYGMWGKNKDAIAAIDKYLETDPTNLQFLLFKLQLTEAIGARPKELYALYEQVLALDPHNATVLNNYAYHLATHGGDIKKAERMSETTIQMQPDNPVFLDTYGWILHLQGQDNLALFYLQRAAQYADKETKGVIEKHLEQVKK